MRSHKLIYSAVWSSLLMWVGHLPYIVWIIWWIQTSCKSNFLSAWMNMCGWYLRKSKWIFHAAWTGSHLTRLLVGHQKSIPLSLYHKKRKEWSLSEVCLTITLLLSLHVYYATTVPLYAPSWIFAMILKQPFGWLAWCALLKIPKMFIFFSF